MYFPTQVSLRTQSYRDGKSNFSSLINLFHGIYFYSIGDGLNMGTDSLRQVDKIQYLPTSQKCRLRGPRFMSSRSDTAIHQPLVAVDVSLSHGLTRNAAQWAVWKQKGHHSVLRTAIMHLDAVLKAPFRIPVRTRLGFGFPAKFETQPKNSVWPPNLT